MMEDQINLQQLYQSNTLDPKRHPALFTLYENPVFFAFSKLSAQRIAPEKLEDAWQKLLTNGLQQQLQQKYFPSEQYRDNSDG